MPNNENRALMAVRKTDTTQTLADKLLPGLSEVDDASCTIFSFKSQISQFWSATETDTFGSVLHQRTKKAFLAYEDTMRRALNSALKKHIRKPTDIIVVTDGFCFSACSFFVDNVIRAGAAIVSGIGGYLPDDKFFVPSQCPSTVIDPSLYVETISNNSYYGLEFRTTFMESYDITNDMKETIPGDFQVFHIDTHLEYYDSLFPKMSDIAEKAAAVITKFQTNCNPDNHRLVFVTDKCSVKDPNALTVGYGCASTGVWDESSCLISTCKPGYRVDFETNKCVKNYCDPRVSMASGVGPFFGIVATLLLFSAFFAL